MTHRTSLLVAALALALFATPALAKKGGLFGEKVTICHVPPGKVVLDDLGKLDVARSKVVKIRTGKSAVNGHELGEILGEHKAHQYDFLSTDGHCVAENDDDETPPAAPDDPDLTDAPE